MQQRVPFLAGEGSAGRPVLHIDLDLAGIDGNAPVFVFLHGVLVVGHNGHAAVIVLDGGRAGRIIVILDTARGDRMDLSGRVGIGSLAIVPDAAVLVRLNTGGQGSSVQQHAKAGAQYQQKQCFPSVFHQLHPCAPPFRPPPEKGFLNHKQQIYDTGYALFCQQK